MFREPLKAADPLMIMNRWILLIAILFALLAGCAPALDSPTGSKNTAVPGSRYIVYTRSGGITGKSSTWTIFEDGRVKADNSLIYQPMPEETTALFNLIPLAAFIQQSKAPRPQVCPDCITAILEYHTGEKTYEVYMVLESSDPANPGRAWVEKIEELLAKSSSK